MKPYGKVSTSKPRLTSLAAVLFLLAGASLLQAGTQDFTLVNETGLTIYQLYLAPTKNGGGDWGGDVLGVDVLESGHQTDITFSPDTTSKVWDLRILDEEEEPHWWRSLRLNEITRITLYFENGEAKADFEWVE